MNISKIVLDDIKQFLETNRELFFNEKDFQVKLSLFLLKKEMYDDVEIEYHLPIGFNGAFDNDYKIWQTEKPSIDIVVRKDDDFVPIELKYKHKAVSGRISRFGICNDVPLITNQGAQNLGRYAFWKDVKRLELVKKHYANIHTGLAVFLTNDKSYQISNRESDYYSFRMDPSSVIGGNLAWHSPKDSYPPFTLTGKYAIEWHTNNMNPLIPESYYAIVVV